MSRLYNITTPLQVDGQVTSSGEINFTSDDTGITFFGGGRLYKENGNNLVVNVPIRFTSIITSNVTTGNAPFVINSTTNVANLNASSLQGNTFGNPGPIGITTPSSGTFTTLGASGIVSITNTTQSTSSITGALTVAGGVGISKDVFIGGNKLNVGPGNSIQNSMLSLYGPANNTTLGPNITATTDSSIYPIFQQLNHDHSNISFNFDCYYNGSIFLSSHIGSCFQIYKETDFKITFANSTSVGQNIGNNSALIINSSGIISFPVNTTIGDNNNSTVSGGALNVSGSLVLGNELAFPAANLGPPTYTNRSIGTRILLYPALSATETDHAIGVGSGFQWFSVADSTNWFSWYSETTEIMKLSGSGDLTLTSTTESNSISTGTIKTAGGVGISKTLNVGNGLYIKSNSKGLTDIADIVLGPATGLSNNDYCSMIRSVSNTASNFGSTLQFFTHQTTTNSGEPSLAMYIDTNQNLIIPNENNGIFFSSGGLYKSTSSNLYLQSATSGFSIRNSTNTASLVDYTNTSTSILIPTSITDTTDSTSSITGALKVTGGVGIGKTLYCGGDIVANRSTTGDRSIQIYSNGTSSRSYFSLDNTVDSGWSVGQDTDDAFKIKGGASGGNNFGAAAVQLTLKGASAGVVVHSTTSSTTKDTGSLVVEGGVGIEENLNVGGSISSSGDIGSSGDQFSLSRYRVYTYVGTTGVGAGVLDFVGYTGFAQFYAKFFIIARWDGNFSQATVISFEVLGAGSGTSNLAVLYNISKNKVGGILGLISDPTVVADTVTYDKITITIDLPTSVEYTVVVQNYSSGGLVNLTQDSVLVKTW